LIGHTLIGLLDTVFHYIFESQVKEVEKPIPKDNEVLTLTISDMTGIQTTNWLMKTAYSHSPILQLPGPAH
jgi:hypothetical protein